MHSFSFERKYLHVGSCGGETPGYDGKISEKAKNAGRPPLSKAPPRAELLHSFYCRPVRRHGEANKESCFHTASTTI